MPLRHRIMAEVVYTIGIIKPVYCARDERFCGGVSISEAAGIYCAAVGFSANTSFRVLKRRYARARRLLRECGVTREVVAERAWTCPETGCEKLWRRLMARAVKQMLCGNTAFFKIYGGTRLEIIELCQRLLDVISGICLQNTRAAQEVFENFGIMPLLGDSSYSTCKPTVEIRFSERSEIVYCEKRVSYENVRIELPERYDSLASEELKFPLAAALFGKLLLTEEKIIIKNVLPVWVSHNI